MTGRGYVRIPAAARHWCQLAVGDRLFVAARPAENLLFLHTLAVVEDVLAEYHAALLGGDHT